MPSHFAVPVRDLRDGDLMRIGSSTTYVLVAHAVPCTDGTVVVTIYDGDMPAEGPTLRFSDDIEVTLRARDLHPHDTIGG
jgi:hypothetical protein